MAGGRSARTPANRLVGALLTAVLLLAGAWLLRSLPGPGGAPVAPAASVSASVSTASAPATDPQTGLRWVTLDELPREASDTMASIRKGPPYPFAKDGTVFLNAERLLPQQARGYYREFTVVTPGSDDRGARRIVAGGPGEFFWTADHYGSFARIRT